MPDADLRTSSVGFFLWGLVLCGGWFFVNTPLFAAGSKGSAYGFTNSMDCVRLLKSEQAWREYKESLGPVPDMAEGKEALKELKAWNQRLSANESWSIKDLVEKNLLRIKSARPLHEGSGQPLPFYTLYFPKAYTGVYVPLSPEEFKKYPSSIGAGFRKHNYAAVAVLMPGIGTTASKALNMASLSGHITKVGANVFRPHMGDAKGEEGIRLYGVLLDSSANGLAEGSPPALNTPQGQVALIRHAQLVLRHVLDFNKFVFMGRSQGGLNVMEFLGHYGPQHGVYGGIACNPSCADLRSVKYGQWVVHNIGNTKILGSMPTSIHKRSWAFHNEVTHLYPLQAPSKAPTLVIYSPQDTPSYPAHIYTKWLGEWLEQSPDRKAVAFRVEDPERAHNLWDVTSDTFMEVMGVNMQFFKQALSED